MMENNYFRVNNKEYCHITNDHVFIFNSKVPTRVPVEHGLSEAWGILSVLNYIFFFLIFIYTAFSVMYYGGDFFVNPVNYAAVFLLILSMKRIMDGKFTSRTPSIQRSKIRSVEFKTPRFSYPRVNIFFEGPEGKVLKRVIPVLYKQEALPVLERTKLLS